MASSITKTLSTAAATASAALKAAPQGGIIDHQNPSTYDPKNPVIIFIIQAAIILIFCRLLHYPLSLIRQPRVIAEVIGGILLGPSVFGRIPGFTNAIFPLDAMPNLTLIANLGLILFLFLVGLEVDVRFLASNWRVALAVSIGGMALPFGLGCGIAWGLYQTFPSPTPISFGVFMLFVGVAMAITAFPVLCRILTELKLLQTPVGIIVLSAGVGNDVTGWILLALCVALVNAGSGITALYVLLTCFGYGLFLVYLLRPAFLWLLDRTRSLQNGPSQGIVALTLLLVLGSAFFTGVIGIHPIFGAFMIGVICPHEGGFAIKLTEKVEDLISALFLPLYFALSGLSTNLGLLNTGVVWAYVIGILAVAFFGKFVGASIAARLSGLVWRESFAIGSLMSCKGLVELIVLNIGLQAKILSTQTFTMFVVMALITTFATTPLTRVLYPPAYQRKIELWKRGEIDWDTGKALTEITTMQTEASDVNVAGKSLGLISIHKMLVYMSFDNIPSIFTLMSILCPPKTTQGRLHPSKDQIEERDENISEESAKPPKRPITAHGVHLVGLTERPSSVMQVSEIDEFYQNDPVVNTFETFGQVYDMNASGEIDVVPEDSFADTLTLRASNYGSDFILLPWSDTGSLRDTDMTKSAVGVVEGEFASFVLRTLKKAPCNAAVFINLSANLLKRDRPSLHRSKSMQSMRSIGTRDLPKPTVPTLGAGTRHIFTPLFGGPDDMLAVSVTLQMVAKGCTASIVRFAMAAHVGGMDDDEPNNIDLVKTKSAAKSAAPAATQPITESDAIVPTATTASSMGIDRQASSSLATRLKTRIVPETVQKDRQLFDDLCSSLAADTLERVMFETVELDDPKEQDAAAACVERAVAELGSLPKAIGGLVVLGRNWKLKGLARRDGGDAEKCLGVVGMEILKGAVKGGMLIVKATAT